jgi:tetratricopeptide (TPR) repeat protein
MTLRMESSLSARRALDALLSTPAPAAPHAAPPATPAAASIPPPVPAVAAGERPKARPVVAASTASSTPSGDSVPALQRQQQAGSDAMAQAQNLWTGGSHDAAMDLMQQSIAAAERSAKTGSGPAGSALLNPLVREMARMQLAEGRFGAVWEMLTRLEPLLGNQADLWAIRANAAQRLGRHQDSVHAYMMALQSRPDEQRWLLGTAVSLAALGQTSSAAEMAEKARAVGPVSKDILAYLRQTGVPLREQ